MKAQIVFIEVMNLQAEQEFSIPEWLFLFNKKKPRGYHEAFR